MKLSLTVIGLFISATELGNTNLYVVSNQSFDLSMTAYQVVSLQIKGDRYLLRLLIAFDCTYHDHCSSCFICYVMHSLSIEVNGIGARTGHLVDWPCDPPFNCTYHHHCSCCFICYVHSLSIQVNGIRAGTVSCRFTLWPALLLASLLCPVADWPSNRQRRSWRGPWNRRDTPRSNYRKKSQLKTPSFMSLKWRWKHNNREQSH